MSIRQLFIGSGVTLACVAAAALSTPVSAEVLFSDGFESGGLDHRQAGAFWRSASNTRVSTDNASSGEYAAVLNFRGSKNLRSDSNANLKFHLAEEQADVWMRYDLFVPKNYEQRLPSDSRHENKGLVTLWGGHSSNPYSRRALRTGVSLWPTARLEGGETGDSYATASFSRNGRSAPQIGHTNPSTVIDTSQDNGNWKAVYINVKAASAGNDGRVAVWTCDLPCGKEDFQDADATFIADGLANTHRSAKGFDRGYIFGWAATGFSEKTQLIVDNVVIATESADLSGTAEESVQEPVSPPKAPGLRFGGWVD